MADQFTLDSLGQLITQTQAELDALEVFVSGQDSTINDNSNDIDDLQNPPNAVPPELLGWFSDGHTITEVDPDLSTSITDLDTTVGTHTTDIAALTSALATETSNRGAADTDLQLGIYDVQSQVTVNLGTLTDEIADRGELAASMATQYETINTRIDGVQADLATETVTRQTSTTTLSSQVATLNAAMQTATTQIDQLSGIGVDPEGALAAQITSLTTIANDSATASTAEAGIRASADTALQNSFNSMSGQVSVNTSNISQEVNDRTSDVAAINSDIGTINTALSGHTADIAAETAARVAADSTLTTNVATNTSNIAANTSAIAAEVTARGAADTAIQAQVTTNTGNIATNTGNIITLQTEVATVQAKYGVTVDGLGYITGYEDLGDVNPDAQFFVRTLNNDIRMQNPVYATKYFAPLSPIAFAAPITFDTQYGSGTSNVFHSLDAVNHTRLVNVYSAGSLVAINGSTFLGPDYQTGGSLQRLGQVLTTFKVSVSGAVSRYLSLWYRIKATPATTSGTWMPVVMTDNQLPASRAYEQVHAEAVIQASVTADQVIEFGFTILSTQDATIGNLNTVIYGGCASVEAFNIVTVA